MSAAPPQHMQALARATEIRLSAAAERRQVNQLGYGAGLHRLAELVEDPPEYVARMRLGYVLQWPRRIGERKALRLLASAGLRASSTHRTVGPGPYNRAPLTDRERRALAAALREAAG